MPIVDVVLPKLGESIMEVTILKWYKNIGDTIQFDETLLDIATDKVDSEVPSPVQGKIVALLFKVNDVVGIGTVIAQVETSQSATSKVENDKVEYTKVENDKVQNTKVENDKVAITPELSTNNIPEEEAIIDIPFTPAIMAAKELVNENNDIKFYSPLVLNIAQNEGISMQELQQMQGTGNLGRVTKKDILALVEYKKTSSSPIKSTENQYQQEEVKIVPLVSVHKIIEDNFPLQFSSTSKFANPEEVILTGNTEAVPVDRMRKLIAKHMMDSIATSAHVTSVVEADVTNLVLWREKVKQLFEKREGTKLTFTPLFMECIAQVLEQYPIINSSLVGDNIIYRKDINIGMATALSNGNLIVPVIKGANQLSLVGLSKAVNALANAARNNKLKPQDTQEGTFTVSNIGTAGGLMGTPIINQPQVAVIALGAIKKRAVVIETPSGDAIVIRHMMFISMSYDHRIVDGAVGSNFLAAVAKAMEAWDPNRQWFQYV